jgi:hypothetical protein
MPFRTVLSVNTFGLAWYRPLNDFINASCASDLSTCTSYDTPALVFSNTTPGCVSNSTCVYYPNQCNYAFITIYDGSSAKKNGFNLRWNAFFKTDSFAPIDLIGPTVDGILMDVLFFAPGPGYLYAHQIDRPGSYIPISDFYLHKTIETSNGLLRSYVGNIGTMFYTAELRHCTTSNWLIGFFQILFSAESSPVAVVPLDYYKDYLPYSELRKAFAYSHDGVNQFGWSVHDMIKALTEVFADRAWAVFDDGSQVLYLYNLTPDYVPDWLIEKLMPTAMKVLKQPVNAAVAKAWLDLLNERNAQIPPQPKLP